MARIGLSFVALAMASVEVCAVACSEGSPAQPSVVLAPGTSGSAGGDAGAACTQIPMPDGGTVKVTGQVVVGTGDAAAPIPNAMVSVEYGGLYLSYCDLSRASPYYVFGAYTDANGKFTIDAKQGALGFHGFATGYFYSRAQLDTSQGTDVTIKMEPLPADQPRPAVGAVGFDVETVAPGAKVTFSADVRAARPADPLSDEIVLVEATRSWSVELDPPSVGKKDDFPDGTWKRSFAAPNAPGTYTYYFSATTGTCVTSDVQTFTLTVR
jgi:hypothetical protein